mmetsp:Transcript_72887/g.236834  ORF Transcript_72887/g.236834 Transcript_72887/m.236834 type:complete len:221 (-) Transcript_72887:4478-5140(-)
MLSTFPSMDTSLAKYIWLTSWPKEQLSSPSGGKELKETLMLPLCKKTLASSGPVTTWRTKVLFIWSYSSGAQRCRQRWFSGVRNQKKGVRLAWKGASPLVGHLAHASTSRSAVPSSTSECQVWSSMLAEEWLYQPLRKVTSSLCRRAVMSTRPSCTAREGFMSKPMLEPFESTNGSRVSSMRLSWRMKTATSGLGLASGSKATPTSTAARTKGTAKRALV